MKKHSLIVEIATFLIISGFFIFPPFFITAANTNDGLFVQWGFPLQQLIMAVIAAVVLYFYYESKSYWLKIFPALFNFCILFCISLIIKFLSMVLPFENTQINVELPQNFSTWIFCILNFLFAAFYEEVIYRFYFPESLNNLLSGFIKWKYLWIICEITACCVFAFAHLYMGILSVFNAMIAHIVLRVCFKKTGVLWQCVAAHFAYNVISLILL